MNRVELIESMVQKTELTKIDVDKALKAFTETIEEELVAGGKVRLVGFGTFSVGERAAREGRNPKTGEVMPIPASKSPKFKAGKSFKEKVNQ